MKNISKVRPTDQPTNRQYFSLQIKIANYLYINNFSFFNNNKFQAYFILVYIKVYTA